MKTCLQNCKPGDVIVYYNNDKYDVVDIQGITDYLVVYGLSIPDRTAARFTQAHMELGRIAKIIKRIPNAPLPTKAL